MSAQEHLQIRTTMKQPETQTTKSKRDLMLDRLKAKHPEGNFEDDEAIYGQIHDDYDDFDKDIKDRNAREEEMKAREAAFSELFTSDPRSSDFLKSWRDGGDPVIELIRQFGTDIKDAIDDPERLDEIAAANKEYLDRISQAKELEEQYQTNLAASLEALEKYQADNGLSDDEVDRIMEFLVTVMKNGILGIFSPESFDMALKAINHDADVAQAGHEGEVKGKNTKVEATLRKNKKSDGTAQLGGKNNSGNKLPKRNLGALDRVSGGSIFERGNEKRTKIQ